MQKFNKLLDVFGKGGGGGQGAVLGELDGWKREDER